MKVLGRDNRVMNGFLEYPDYVKNLLERPGEGLAVADDVLRGVKRVIVTGNGDSYAAALATKEFNSRMFEGCDYHALRCIDVSRHYVFPTENPAQTLVIVISVSGSGARVTEAMRRARAKGCTTLAITGHPESRLAREAQYVLRIETGQPRENSPVNQTRTYFAAVLTTMLLGLRAGRLFGVISRDEAAAQRLDIIRYVSAVCSPDVLGGVDERMFALAQKWKDYLGYGFVGGGSDFATACFSTAKFFELCGSLNCLNDSEDWCHIDYFQTDREKLGTIVFASSKCASFSRTLETIASMQLSGRNVLAVTDAEEGLFPEGVEVCALPAAAYEHISPLMNFIPAFMLGNYIAIMRGYEYFGGMDDSNPLFSQDGAINTIKSSRIVYVE